MPVWLGGGIGPIQQDVLSQSSVESTSQDIGWVYEPGTEVPEQAFPAFADGAERVVFIGRTVLDGDLVPGMVLQHGHDTLHTLFANKGKVCSSDDKQILCGANMRWVPCLPDKIHPNAVIGGRLAAGDLTYIGYAIVQGEMLIGRVDPTQNRQLFVPISGEELALSVYHILVEGM